MRIAAAALAVAAAVAGCKSRDGAGGSSKGTDSPLAPTPPQLEVTIVATDVDTPLGLAVDGEHMYWSDGPKIMRAPKQGGAPSVLCEVEALQIRSIVSDGDTLYFGATGGGLFRVRKTGGKPMRIASSGNPRSLAVDATRVYWYDGSERMTAKDGDTEANAPIHFTAGGDAELVADDTHLYWHTGTKIVRRAKAGGDVEPIAQTGHLGVELAIDDTYLYWGDDAGDVVLRWPKAGGPLELVSDDWGSGNLVVDGEWLYVANINTSVTRIHTGDLRRASLAYAPVKGENSNNVTLIADESQLFVGVDGMRWDTSGGVAHIDLTKADPDVPEMIPLGKVGRMPKDLAGIEYTPRPAYAELATVWFDADKVTAQDIGNATRWVEGFDHHAQQLLVGGKLTVRLVAGGDEALAKQRAASVVDALRERLGDAAAIEVTLSGTRADVVIGAAPDEYAALWAI